MEIQDMCKYEKDIKKYSVRLHDAGTCESGSGFVLAYQESKYIYIFTALHVVLGMFTKVGGQCSFYLQTPINQGLSNKK